MAFSFGQAAAQPAAQQPQQQGGSSLFSGFGANASQPAAQQPAKPAGFSFGAASQPAATTAGQTGFSFGGAMSQPQQQAGTTAQQPAPGGLFGQSTATTGAPAAGATGGFSFGQPASQPAANTSTSLFGQPAQQQQQQPAASTSTSLFGQSTQAPQQQTQLGSSLFGQSQAQTQNQAQQQQQAAQAQQQLADKKLGVPLNTRIEAVRAAWDSNNIAACRFLCYFYNTIPPGIVPPIGPAGAGGPGGSSDGMANPNFGRRPDAIGPRHDQLWAAAVRENPDRSRLVPVLCVGFPELKTRVDLQHAEATRQRARLAELQKRVEDLSAKHSLSNSVRAAAFAKRQAHLHHRVMSLARHAHMLIPALRGSSVLEPEERLRSLLEACREEMEGGKGGGRLAARVNELWAVLGQIKARRRTAGADGDATHWAVVDQDALDDVAKILSSQQQGLDYLETTLTKDTKALEVIIEGLRGVQLVGVRGGGVGR